MGRSESKKAFQQSSDLGKQSAANADRALTATNIELGTFKKNLGNFMDFGRKTYGEGGDYAKTMNTLGTTNAAAGARGLESDLALNRMRTGSNTASYAPTIAESRRSASRDLTDFEARNAANRMGLLTGIEQYGVDASKFPVQVQQGLYGSSLGGANQAYSSAADAARTPGFWDQFAPALVGGISNVAAALIKKDS